MATFTRPADLVRHQMERFRKFGTDIETAHHEMVYGGLQDAKELTSGGLSKTQTRGAYARGMSPSLSSPSSGRRMMTPAKLKSRGLSKRGAPLLPINIQSGRLSQSLFIHGPSGRQKVYEIGFSAKHAQFILSPDGTIKMVARGFFEEIAKRHKARASAWIRVIRENQLRS